jgi:hypothetical protein
MQGVSKLMRAHAMWFNHRNLGSDARGGEGVLRGEAGAAGVSGNQVSGDDATCFG